MQFHEVRQYYSSEAIQEQLLAMTEKREVVPRFMDAFGKRPSLVNMPGDLQAWVKKGATSLHASVERWRNPLHIGQQDAEELRTGWDLLIDIDASRMPPHLQNKGLQYSLELLKLLLEELRAHNVQHYSVKFSGNRGFHIMINQEAFPETIKGSPQAAWYPTLPKQIITYLRERVKDAFTAQILGTYATTYDIDPYEIIDVENSWSHRHLFRMPYALNEKTWLVSVPLTEDALEEFRTVDALPEKVEGSVAFMPDNKKDEAADLVVESLDFAEQQEPVEVEQRPQKIPESVSDKIPQTYFPPPIQKLLEGVRDGRKRSLFILISFLKHMNYPWRELEEEIWAWNQRNAEPLRNSYIRGQLNWHRQQNKQILPPNYDKEGFYGDILPGGYRNEERFSNPVTSAYARYKQAKSYQKKDE